jgi:excisionase family DNA binding protein
MAKMFYTLDEAAKRLGKSEDQVKQMVSSGQLQEFRDRDRMMLKRDQVDLIAGDGGGDDTSLGLGSGVDLEPISLASSGSQGLGASGSGFALAGDAPARKEASGISIFDDDLEVADPNAQTHVNAARNVEFADKGGSGGSGLLEAAREADDTSLGADILGNVYGDQQDTMSATATDHGGALFESTGAEVADSGAVVAPMMTMESFDGKGSGLAGGLALGMVITLAVAIAVAVFGLTGMSGGLMDTIAQNFWAVVGGLAAFTLICGIIGLVVGGKS